MNWYKKSQKKRLLFHISNELFKKFDINKSAQGIIWFAKDKNKLIKDKLGASINSNRKTYLYECFVDINKTANWDEYDKYTLMELENMGYDSIELDDVIAVLDPKIISINKVEII